MYFYQGVHQKICDIVCPGHSDNLFHTFSNYIAKEEGIVVNDKYKKLVETIVNLSTELPKMSLQKRALLAPLTNHFTNEKSKNLVKTVNEELRSGRENLQRQIKISRYYY